jgi:hypothetical protein
MMGDRFRLCVRLAKRLRGAAMQNLAAALQQAVVGSVLDERMLEVLAAA